MAVKEGLRLLLKQREPSKIKRRLADFNEAVIDANLMEATQLAKTVENLVAGDPGRPHPRRQQCPHRAFNRVIKPTKRVACGFRSQVNYPRRILSHIALTRPQRSAA